MRSAKELTLVVATLACAVSVSSSICFAAEKAALQQRMAAAQNVEFDVYLPLQHKAELEALLDSLHDPGSPSYHKWLTPAQFSARFGASARTVATVTHELENYGLTATLQSSQRIHVTGPARSVEQIFLTELHTGIYKNGRKTAVAVGGISLPGAMASSNAVVAGLSGFIRMQSHVQNLGAAEPGNRLSIVGPYWFDDLKQAYRYPSFQVFSGKGVTIGVLMANAFNPEDMTKYFSHENLAVPNITTVNINGGAPFDPDLSFETHLDLQQTGGMAPEANLVLYNVPDLSDANILAGLSAINLLNDADVVNMSFFGPELFYTPAFNNGVDFTGILEIFDDVFQQGNAQGITFVAASGDLGSNPVPPLACFAPHATSSCGSFLESAVIPASSPHVTGVGGTNLVTARIPGSLDSTYVSEAAFGDPLAADIFFGTPATGGIWASGGGISIFFKKPGYQHLVNTGSKKFRTMPDVSLQMGGCPIGSVLPCGSNRSSTIVAIDNLFFRVIGTSISAPDFTGLTALKIQARGGRLGNENQEIYVLAKLQSLGVLSHVYNDNIPGSNGLFTTHKGYNLVLGNGTVNGVEFLLAPETPVAGTPQTPSNP